MKHFDFDTLAVHAGRDDFRELGVHAPPLDLSTTYPIPDLAEGTADIDAMLRGERPSANNVYARLANPTVDRFEKAFAELECADDAVSFGSGMAAVSAALLAATLCGKRHVIAVRPLYGGTDHLLASGLLGLDVTFTAAGTVSDHVRADTALVVIETPANPTIALVDIADVVRQAGEVPVLVDSTFATPILQQPLLHGAAMSLHSATKFIGGHGDVMAGVIACTDEWARHLRLVRILTGGVLHPMAAYLLHRGLQTLPIRVRAAQASAMVLAQELLQHPSVSRVFFPGLAGGDPHQLLGRQMRGPGTMIAFEMADGFDAAASVMRNVTLMTPAVSLGSADTLIQHPAGLTHRVVDQAGLDEGGVTAGMLRVSVGLEDVTALWKDLEAAIEISARVELVSR